MNKIFKHAKKTKDFFKLFSLLSLAVLKSGFKKKKRHKKTKYKRDFSHVHNNLRINNFNVGDLVSISDYSREVYLSNRHRGCCNPGEKCICEIMYNSENIKGIVVKVEKNIVEIQWSNNHKNWTSVEHVKKI